MTTAPKCAPPPAPKQPKPIKVVSLSEQPELASDWTKTVRETRCFHCKKFLEDGKLDCYACKGMLPRKLEKVDIKYIHIKPPANRATLAEVAQMPPAQPAPEITDPNVLARKQAKERDRIERFKLFDPAAGMFHYEEEGKFYYKLHWDDAWMKSEVAPASVAQMHPDDG